MLMVIAIRRPTHPHDFHNRFHNTQTWFIFIIRSLKRQGSIIFIFINFQISVCKLIREPNRCSAGALRSLSLWLLP